MNEYVNDRQSDRVNKIQIDHAENLESSSDQSSDSGTHTIGGASYMPVPITVGNSL